MENIFYFNNIPIRYKFSKKNDINVILLHGFLENLNIYDELFNTLSKEYSILSIDLLGHGKSGYLDETHSMEKQAEMINSLASSLNINKYFIIGHSMGGYISNIILDKYPKSIEGICLINSHTFADDDNAKKKRLEMISLLEKGQKNKIIEGFIQNIFYIKDKHHISKIKTIAKMCHKKGIINCILGMKERKDTTDIFINSSCRKLIIQGKYDTIINTQKIKETFSFKKNIYLIEVETGHISFLEDFEKSLYLIKNFIDGN